MNENISWCIVFNETAYIVRFQKNQQLRVFFIVWWLGFFSILCVFIRVLRVRAFIGTMEEISFNVYELLFSALHIKERQFEFDRVPYLQNMPVNNATASSGLWQPWISSGMFK